MIPLTVILITKNSENVLSKCLQSIQILSPKIVVVDGFSTDKSVEIANRFGAKVVQRKLDGFGKQKQFALDIAEPEWVLLLDSDEQITPELGAEIQKVLSKPDAHAYRIPRKNHYFGKWLRFGGKFPDYQVRLLKKQRCRFSDDIIHEKLIVQGKVGTLKNPLLHHSYPDIDTWFRKLELFSRFRAEELVLKNTPHSPFNFFRYFFFRPWTRFFRKFIFKFGFLDGIPGLMACLHDALTEILSYLFFALERRSRS